ncbi:uncharacterized protein TRIADDRAFT_53995 [Trichoplax adhaerens]|uniref:Deoxynucleoside kinase domain-containing protein n=1 Tax=Trichoplax adhaerens TaxID=10228 RepID=B3RQT8_TRIAD|nr:hypothetical protein TRIADDRAFT_53995 [Trichoplax adhaerens]EDV26224.1 hypothetical protein TRIADDRAFT_53995 [Trichoplax adhaerens]|eukprot:XP_002110220.1 hypothetical protein TRIADDRAFT_53995 [Trichoplax adhaerens]
MTNYLTRLLKKMQPVRSICSHSANITQLTHTHTNTAKIISVEGNIGAGKTTLANNIGEILGYKVFYEPVNQNPYLAKFYESPKDYAFKLQLWIYRQRFLIYCNALQHYLSTGQGVILDRSVYSDRVFAKTGNNDGFISSTEYDQYELLRQQLLNRVIPPHLLVYLHVSPTDCLERVRKRGRIYEKSISTSYLQKLEDEFDNFVEEMRFFAHIFFYYCNNLVFKFKQCSCRRSGVSVYWYDWSKYGNIEKIIADINRQDSTVENSKNINEVKKFICNREEILSILHPYEIANLNDEIDQKAELDYWLREQIQ